MSWERIKYTDAAGQPAEMMFNRYKIFGGQRPITNLLVDCFGSPIWNLRKQIRDEMEIGDESKRLMGLVREISESLQKNRESWK